jgi:hypothetical protein
MFLSVVIIALSIDHSAFYYPKVLCKLGLPDYKLLHVMHTTNPRNFRSKIGYAHHELAQLETSSHPLDHGDFYYRATSHA